MHWLAIIFFGLLTGLIGAVYGGFIANLSVTWLRISSFEGGSGYFVVFMILLAFPVITAAMAMLYRSEVEFAVGHGISVHAEVSHADVTCAHTITTVVVPSYEVPKTIAPTIISS